MAYRPSSDDPRSVLEGRIMAEEKPGHHPRHVPGDLDPQGHRDKAGQKEVPGEHHDHPGHVPGDLDPQGHRDHSK
jgi:hypothetical protein